MCPILKEAMDPLPLQMIKQHVSILKECSVWQYTGEIIKTITVQLPASSIKSSLEIC